MFAGYRPEEANMAVKPPLHPASTFVFPDARTGAAHMETAYGVEGAETPPDGFIYSRLGNPTLRMAEARLAACYAAAVRLRRPSLFCPSVCYSGPSQHAIDATLDATLTATGPQHAIDATRHRRDAAQVPRRGPGPRGRGHAG